MNCVKASADHFSLQHGLEVITGGRIGNGWVAEAVLGSSVSSGIEFFRSLSGKEPGQAVRILGSDVLTEAVGPAAKFFASDIPNISVTVGGAAAVTVQTPGFSASGSIAGRVSGVIPTGAFARAGAEFLDVGLHFVGTVKTPIDLAVGGFSSLICAIGR